MVKFYLAALKERNLIVNTICYGDEGVFIAFDVQESGVMWVFSQASAL